jgi:hypothetical protein
MSQTEMPFGQAGRHDCRFSPNRRYRYEWWEVWGDRASFAQFVCLNPSTADESRADPTVRRVVGFAKRWGYGAVVMTNLFAFRATDPRVMRAEPDPVGPENNATIWRLAQSAGAVVAAWGRHGAHGGRAELILGGLAGPVWCLARNKDGSPKHPLYVAADRKLELLQNWEKNEKTKKEPAGHAGAG